MPFLWALRLWLCAVWFLDLAIVTQPAWQKGRSRQDLGAPGRPSLGESLARAPCAAEAPSAPPAAESPAASCQPPVAPHRELRRRNAREGTDRGSRTSLCRRPDGASRAPGQSRREERARRLGAPRWRSGRGEGRGGEGSGERGGGGRRACGGAVAGDGRGGSGEREPSARAPSGHPPFHAAAPPASVLASFAASLFSPFFLRRLRFAAAFLRRRLALRLGLPPRGSGTMQIDGSKVEVRRGAGRGGAEGAELAGARGSEGVPRSSRGPAAHAARRRRGGGAASSGAPGGAPRAPRRRTRRRFCRSAQARAVAESASEEGPGGRQGAWILVVREEVAVARAMREETKGGKKASR